MKQIILSLIVLLGASLNACMAKDNQTSETRNISGYTSIRIDGVATVRFTQGDTWSCRIEGKAEELDRLTTTVKNGTLIIDQRKEGKREQNIQGTTLYLSAPTLDEVEIDGVGNSNAKNPKSRRHPFRNRRRRHYKSRHLHCQTVQIISTVWAKAMSTCIAIS